MNIRIMAGALALGLITLPSLSWADDPHDPLMRDPRARARDHEIIRQLNLAELRKVRARDARMARQWRAWREWQEDHGRDR